MLRLPRVLFIVDSPNWAHDFKSENIKMHLQLEFDIRKVYQSHVTAHDIEWTDLIVVFYWLQFVVMNHLFPVFRENRHKLLCGICSHVELSGARRETGLLFLNSYAKAVFVNNRLLESEYAPLLAVPIHYTPNGVNTAFFGPADEPARVRMPLRIGWAGSLGNMGPAVRGFSDVIEAATKSVEDVRLVAAIREDRHRTPLEMRDFYRGLDAYVCASESEGTPNPCLEAAACGLPLVTTRVGNMPEFVVEGENGFFIDRSPSSLAGRLAWLKSHLDQLVSMGREARRTALNWDWSLKSRPYAVMFHAALNEQRPREPTGLQRPWTPR
jgi:glycosyltransferase involved in cell wall biosynthesis